MRPVNRIWVLVAMTLFLLAQLVTSNSSSAAPAPRPLEGPAVFGHSGWEIVPIPLPADNDLALACLTSSNCVAAGDGGNGGTAFIKTTDGGITWTAAGAYAYGIGGLSCLATGFCLAVPYGGDPHLIVSTDAGTIWTPIAQPPFIPASLTAIGAACTQAFCIVTGGDSNGNIPAHSSAAFVTFDRGKTWSAITLPAPMKDLQALSCNPAGKCYLVYDTYTNQFSDMATTSNHGHTWTPIVHARGFTSQGGFACPSQRSCVYLATQLLEISSGRGPQWTNDFGPFEKKQNGSISAFALSCTATNRCMIGGGVGNQAVVWIEGPAWSSARVTASLQRVAGQVDESYESASARLASAPSGSDFAADFNAVERVIDGNISALGALALHARGHQGELIGAVEGDWSALLGDLGRTASDLNDGRDTTLDKAQLTADVKAIAKAEHLAGLRKQLSGSALGWVVALA
jgi:hypothetical protein